MTYSNAPDQFQFGKQRESSTVASRTIDPLRCDSCRTRFQQACCRFNSEVMVSFFAGTCRLREMNARACAPELELLTQPVGVVHV
jgi:hypothetical protein